MKQQVVSSFIFTFSQLVQLLPMPRLHTSRKIINKDLPTNFTCYDLHSLISKGISVILEAILNSYFESGHI